MSKETKPSTTAVTPKKDFICNYKQQWSGRRGRSNSEHQHGRRKRWYVQFFPHWLEKMPEKAVTEQKLGVKSMRVNGPGMSGAKLAK